MTEFAILLIGNLLFIAISIFCIRNKNIVSHERLETTRHLIALLLALVVFGIFCGVFVLLNFLEMNNTLTQSFVKGAVAGMYVIGFALLGFTIFCGLFALWQKRKGFS